MGEERGERDSSTQGLHKEISSPKLLTGKMRGLIILSVCKHQSSKTAVLEF